MDTDVHETLEQKRLRSAYEAALIAEARVQLDAGLGRTGEDLEAWLTAWEGTGPLPTKYPPE